MTIGLGTVALGIAVPQKAGANVGHLDSAELFAFHAPDSPRFVFALALAITGIGASTARPTVRIHAGTMSWLIEGASGRPAVTLAVGRDLTFTGRLNKATQFDEVPHHLIALATLSEGFASGDYPVWAEILTENEEPFTVGNPILAELLNRGSPLSQRFHKRRILADALAEQAAEPNPIKEAGNNGVYEKYLFARLSPDVLHFDPAKPIGFTFAGQNGRRPTDSIAELAATVLAGRVSTSTRNEVSFRGTTSFPYIA